MAILNIIIITSVFKCITLINVIIIIVIKIFAVIAKSQSSIAESGVI